MVVVVINIFLCRHKARMMKPLQSSLYRSPVGTRLGFSSTVQYSTVQGQEVTAVVLTAEYSKHVEDFYYINLSRLFHTKVAFKLLRTLLKSHKHVYGYNCMRILSGFGFYLATSLSLSASNN